jgi:hypothetical protein
MTAAVPRSAVDFEGIGHHVHGVRCDDQHVGSLCRQRLGRRDEDPSELTPIFGANTRCDRVEVPGPDEQVGTVSAAETSVDLLVHVLVVADR